MVCTPFTWLSACSRKFYLNPLIGKFTKNRYFVCFICYWIPCGWYPLGNQKHFLTGWISLTSWQLCSTNLKVNWTGCGKLQWDGKRERGSALDPPESQLGSCSQLWESSHWLKRESLCSTHGSINLIFSVCYKPNKLILPAFIDNETIQRPLSKLTYTIGSSNAETRSQICNSKFKGSCQEGRGELQKVNFEGWLKMENRLHLFQLFQTYLTNEDKK